MIIPIVIILIAGWNVCIGHGRGGARPLTSWYLYSEHGCRLHESVVAGGAPVQYTGPLGGAVAGDAASAIILGSAVGAGGGVPVRGSKVGVGVDGGVGDGVDSAGGTVGHCAEVTWKGAESPTGLPSSTLTHESDAVCVPPPQLLLQSIDSVVHSPPAMCGTGCSPRGKRTKDGRCARTRACECVSVREGGDAGGERAGERVCTEEWHLHALHPLSCHLYVGSATSCAYSITKPPSDCKIGGTLRICDNTHVATSWNIVTGSTTLLPTDSSAG